MSEPNPLPEPAADALWHSEKLTRLIRRRIEAAGGWLDFADYMDMALYEPGYGYYSAGAQKFGAAGDFVTAPEISPLFAATLAQVCAEILGGGEPAGQTLLEVGAGSGALAAGLLESLHALDALPGQYCILEVSADLRERQQALLAERVPALLDRVVWLDTLPDEPFDGLVVANEVLDALPVSRFTINAAGQVLALGVGLEAGLLTWQSRTAAESLEARVRAIENSLGTKLPPGYQSELTPGLDGFINGLSDLLRDGVMLFIDYGLPRRDYYAPERQDGTLACHYRHRRHSDPFFYPGLQDLTAWVDFTAVAEAADAAGLDVLGYTTQARFLVAAGIETVYAQLAEKNVTEEQRLRWSAELQQLMMPGQMGEHFKVMALGRGQRPWPPAVAAQDLLHLL